MLGFARGLMDTDGFVSNRVGCGVVSERLIDNLKEILSKNYIKSIIKIIKRPLNRRDLYLLTIDKRNLNNYEQKIGFSNLRKKKELLKKILKMRPPGFELSQLFFNFWVARWFAFFIKSQTSKSNQVGPLKSSLRLYASKQ